MLYNRLALLRTDAGLSRQQLADKVGVNYQTIGFIERGDYNPSLELAFRIAEVFGVELLVVFSDKPYDSIFANERKK